MVLARREPLKTTLHLSKPLLEIQSSSLTQPSGGDSLDNEGHITTAHIPGNEEEFETAVAAAEPWHAGNELALGCIYSGSKNHPNVWPF